MLALANEIITQPNNELANLTEVLSEEKSVLWEICLYRFLKQEAYNRQKGKSDQLIESQEKLCNSLD